jgi:hypothetical protein
MVAPPNALASVWCTVHDQRFRAGSVRSISFAQK